MTHLVEVNAGRLNIVRDFFDNYSDGQVTLTVKEEPSKIRVIYAAETELDKATLERHLKNEFKTKSPNANAIMYSIKVK